MAIPQTTAKQEAQQAVRLLYKWAVKAAVHEPESLYQARQLLEGFIESAGELGGIKESQREPIEIIFEGATFREGEFIYAEGPNGIRPELIEHLSPDTNWIEYSRNGFHHSCHLVDVIANNPGGSK